MKDISRRKFIGQASCASIGYATLLSSLMNLKAINAAAISNSSVWGGEDYKALICIMQSGGNDSFNMLLPRDQSAYNTYAKTRSNLAIDRDEILPINPVQSAGLDLGVHPSMSGVQKLFNDQKLSFISNIGTLVEPITKDQFYNDSKPTPLGLFSHSDQIQQWQTGFTNERSAIGWGGKMADMIKDVNDNKLISMNISLSGTNVFQNGNETVEFVIDSDGSAGIYGYKPDNMYNIFDIQRTKAIDSMVEANYVDAFQKTYVDVIRNSRDADLAFRAAMENVAPLNTTFSNNYFSDNLAMIARVLSGRQDMGMKRQIFFVEFGGWDHHDEVLDSQEAMLEMLSNGMSELNAAIEELGLSDNVVTFTMSEFGRTLTSNGNGSDHAWGGNVMTMGGPVNGGKVFGKYPSLELDNPLDLGDGSLIPELSTDQYLAEVALWFGVEKSELTNLFPNIGTFYDTSSNDTPLGLLNI